MKFDCLFLIECVREADRRDPARTGDARRVDMSGLCVCARQADTWV